MIYLITKLLLVFYNVALCTAVVGAEKGSIYIKNILNMYETGNYETEKTVFYGGDYVDLYKKEFSIPGNEYWTWCIIKNNQRFKLNNRKQHINDVVVYLKEYFGTGAILGNWYTRHLDLNSWKKETKNTASVLGKLKKYMESCQLIWTVCRKIKFKKVQKSTSFYRNRDRVGNKDCG